MESDKPTTNIPGLQALPREILMMLPEFLHNMEDYVNISSTCRLLRECMATTRPHTILQLAWESRQTFFQPSPQLLSTVIAAQVGSWVRESDENEAELVAGLGRKGMYHIMDLALRHKHIGLTMERIRELHEMKFSVINPVTKIMEECQKGLNYHVDADILFFFLATYGELFGPDYEPFLNPALPLRRRLKFETRLKFVQKYIPGAATESLNVDSIRLPDGSDNLNGRRMIAQNLYFLLFGVDFRKGHARKLEQGQILTIFPSSGPSPQEIGGSLC